MECRSVFVLKVTGVKATTGLSGVRHKSGPGVRMRRGKGRVLEKRFEGREEGKEEME
jgi:hypothetical protein